MRRTWKQKDVWRPLLQPRGTRQRQTDREPRKWWGLEVECGEWQHRRLGAQHHGLGECGGREGLVSDVEDGIS